MPMSDQERDPLRDHMLTATEVAELFRVDVKTIGRWTRAGHLPHITKPGGKYRLYPESRIRALLQSQKEN